MNFDYVTKMTYNKDKDLVFVHRPNGFWNEHEHVYEVHHLEQMVNFKSKFMYFPGTCSSDIIQEYDNEQGRWYLECV